MYTRCIWKIRAELGQRKSWTIIKQNVTKFMFFHKIHKQGNLFLVWMQGQYTTRLSWMYIISYIQPCQSRCHGLLEEWNKGWPKFIFCIMYYWQLKKKLSQRWIEASYSTVRYIPQWTQFWKKRDIKRNLLPKSVCSVDKRSQKSSIPLPLQSTVSELFLHQKLLSERNNRIWFY